jgi:hypothetical protein
VRVRDDGIRANEMQRSSRQVNLESTMSSEKVEIVAPPPAKHPCPVCGKASYSPGGIHPQCAMQQADEPRLARLRAARSSTPKPAKTARQSWQKKCPECGKQSHVSRQSCECGHKFVSR